MYLDSGTEPQACLGTVSFVEMITKCIAGAQDPDH